jgi:NO-binding membrane sensor protein with MHYT domain
VSKHDQLLEQGPRQAPEPETAEERSSRLGMKSAGGVVVGGGIAAAKFGGLAKLFLWLFAWNGVRDAWRIGGWIAIAVLAAVVTLYFVARSRRQQA